MTFGADAVSITTGPKSRKPNRISGKCPAPNSKSGSGSTLRRIAEIDLLLVQHKPFTFLIIPWRNAYTIPFLCVGLRQPVGIWNTELASELIGSGKCEHIVSLLKQIDMRQKVRDEATLLLTA
jgi:hypothetical protein